jgi:GT2 family glycosyltransferase
MSERVDCNPNLSIVLVNYKSLEMTSICMDLIQQGINVAEVPVWVVDNDSNDASLEYLKSLDWIHLIERKPPSQETGFMAHGAALDIVLDKVSTDYLLLLHTDTFIHDPSIVNIMLEKCIVDDKVVAVGCLEPVCRSLPQAVWRFVVRGAKYYFRRTKIALGINTRAPKLHYEIYLKSFCALWNVKIIKQHGMTFSMADRIPGYEMQDRLPELGYKFVAIPPREMFKYLDHIEKGTVSATNGYKKNHRKVKNYQVVLNKLQSKN